MCFEVRYCNLKADFWNTSQNKTRKGYKYAYAEKAVSSARTAKRRSAVLPANKRSTNIHNNG